MVRHSFNNVEGEGLMLFRFLVSSVVAETVKMSFCILLFLLFVAGVSYARGTNPLEPGLILVWPLLSVVCGIIGALFDFLCDRQWRWSQDRLREMTASNYYVAARFDPWSIVKFLTRKRG